MQICGLDTKVQANLDIAVTDSAAKLQALQLKREEQMKPKVQTDAGVMNYTGVYTMEATAYLPTDGASTGTTAMGIPATYGVAVADPNVIPLGTCAYSRLWHGDCR